MNVGAQQWKTGAGGRRVTLGLYVASVFLYWISLYLYVPTLPVYVEDISGSLAIVGVVISMYGLWQAVVRLPVGIAADWIGRCKPFIVCGFLLAGLGAWTMGAAEDANSLIIGRAITGLAASTWVPLVVVFSTLFPPEQAVRVTASLSLVGSVGRVLATVVTGSLNQLGGYSLAFYLAAGAAALAILFVLPAQEPRRKSRTPSLAGVVDLFARSDVLIPSLLGAVGRYAIWMSTFCLIPLLAKQIGATDVIIAVLTSMNLGLESLGNFLATILINRLRARRLVYVSFGLLSLGIGIGAFAHNLFLIFAAQFCIGLAGGIGSPVLMGMSIRYVQDGERTTAMGLHQAVYAVGMFAGPGLSGTLADAMGMRPMFGLTAMFCLIAGFVGVHRLSDSPKRGK